jgi:hypothetical protein
MPYTNSSRHAMLDRLVGKTHTLVITQLSLHTADPGPTGANEVTGNGYARHTVGPSDFGNAGASTQGAILLAGDKLVAGPASSSVLFYGVWGAGPTFMGSGSLTGDLAFNAAGELILKAGTSLDLNAA